MSATTLMLRAAISLTKVSRPPLPKSLLTHSTRDGLRLDAVAHVVGDLRHAELLAERGAEDVGVALLRDRRRLAADDLRNLGLLREQHVDQHRAGEDRAENDVGLVVEHLLHLRARDAGVALGVEQRRVDLLAENAALGVDLLDRQQHAVAEIGAGHGAGAGQFENGGHVDGRLREDRTGRRQPRRQSPTQEVLNETWEAPSLW